MKENAIVFWRNCEIIMMFYVLLRTIPIFHLPNYYKPRMYFWYIFLLYNWSHVEKRVYIQEAILQTNSPVGSNLSDPYSHLPVSTNTTTILYKLKIFKSHLTTFTFKSSNILQIQKCHCLQYIFDNSLLWRFVCTRKVGHASKQI